MRPSRNALKAAAHLLLAPSLLVAERNILAAVCGDVPRMAAVSHAVSPRSVQRRYSLSRSVSSGTCTMTSGVSSILAAVVVQPRPPNAQNVASMRSGCRKEQRDFKYNVKEASTETDRANVIEADLQEIDNSKT